MIPFPPRFCRFFSSSPPPPSPSSFSPTEGILTHHQHYLSHKSNGTMTESEGNISFKNLRTFCYMTTENTNHSF
jgi:hypothetical protein